MKKGKISRLQNKQNNSYQSNKTLKPRKSPLKSASGASISECELLESINGTFKNLLSSTEMFERLLLAGDQKKHR